MSDVLVLCYHSISPRLPDRTNVRPEVFERQISSLVRRGYRGVRFREAVLGSPGRGRIMAVTFDDGYASVAEHALPVLERLGVPGTVFAVTDLTDLNEPMIWPGLERWRGGPYERELVGIGWDGLRMLADAGWEIGSHTRRHPWLPACDDDRLADELLRSREQVEQRLGRSCDTLAYPYGGVDPRVAAAARAAGYAAAASIASTRRGDPLDHPRVGVYGFDTRARFALKRSALVRSAQRRLRPREAWPEPLPQWLPSESGGSS